MPTRRQFSILKTTLQVDFSLPGVSKLWQWIGEGLEGRLVVERERIRIPNDPVPGVDRIIDGRDEITLQDLHTRYFMSIPPARFARATIRAELGAIIISLNQDDP
jgi:hypothetical protein